MSEKKSSGSGPSSAQLSHRLSHEHTHIQGILVKAAVGWGGCGGGLMAVKASTPDSTLFLILHVQSHFCVSLE